MRFELDTYQTQNVCWTIKDLPKWMHIIDNSELKSVYKIDIFFSFLFKAEPDNTNYQTFQDTGGNFGGRFYKELGFNSQPR